MRRKLIRQGDNALTVTLPAKWIQSHGLKAGEEVEIEESSNQVIIQADSKTEKKSAELKLTTKSEQIIRSNLNVLYRVGFDRIKVYFNTPEQQKIVKGVADSRMLGFEVIEENKNLMILENVTEPSEEKQEVLLRRIFLIIKDSFAVMTEDFNRNDFPHSSNLIQNSKNVDRYSNFCNRNISKKRFTEERIHSYWDLYSRLLLIQHSLLHLYEIIDKNRKIKLSSHTEKVFHQVRSNFEQLYEGFSKRDLKILEKVNDFAKQTLNQEILLQLKKNKGEDNLVLYYCGEISRLIYLCTVPLFAIYYSEKA